MYPTKQKIMNKYYVFRFEGGGWNHITARNIDEAKRTTQSRYKNRDHLTPIMNSFTPVTYEKLQTLMMITF